MSEKLPDTTETVVEYPLPSEDFFRHVNGEWLDTTEIPASKSRWGAFDILRQLTTDRLNELAISTSHQTDAEKGSDIQMIGDFYKSAIDMEARDARGIEPLAELRTEIQSIATKSDVARVAGILSLNGPNAFIGAGVGEDKKNAGTNVTYIHQGGIHMPDRDYYLSDEPSMVEVRQKYMDYLAHTFELAGYDESSAKTAAQSVYDIEHGLAEHARTKAECRQVENNYTKYSRDELDQTFPKFDWQQYFAGIGIPDVKNIVVSQPEFVEYVETLVDESSIEDLKAYLEFTLITDKSAILSQDFLDNQFEFYGKTLNGLKEPAPLHEKAINVIETSSLAHAIGPMYCDLYFDEQDKARVMDMVHDITEAFRNRVARLDWMSDETKALTLQKLDGITFKMGFPDEWLDVSSIDINPDDYAGNRLRMSKFSANRNFQKADKPYQTGEWNMKPTTVNACADLKREMTFPAAILQPPFYDSERDAAYNYGAIGMVIGHELSHFFDDQGSKFDVDGNVNPWWSEQDQANFAERAQKFVDYYSGLSANGYAVNGELTQGENIADVAGLAIAFDAYMSSEARQNAPEIADGMTPEQRFFAGYTRNWATKITPEAAKSLSLRDPHSPGEVRANGVLAISPEFHRAFGIKPGDNMYVPEADRPKIW